MTAYKTNQKYESIKITYPAFYNSPLTLSANRISIANLLSELTKAAFYQSKVKQKDSIISRFQNNYSDFSVDSSSDNLFDLYVASVEAISDLGFATNSAKIFQLDKDLFKFYKKIKNLELDDIIYKIIEYKVSQL